MVANALSRQNGADDAFADLAAKTIGLVFNGTPFCGSKQARWATIAMAFSKVFGAQCNPQIVKELETGSGRLPTIVDSFYRYMKGRDTSGSPMKIICLYEEEETVVKKKTVGILVTKESATLRGIESYAIQTHHRAICKYANDQAVGYKYVSGFLARVIKKISEPGNDANDASSRGGVHMGEVHYHGEIKNNHGLVFGNVYGKTPKANILTGQVS